jgi:hypothetical protein
VIKFRQKTKVDLTHVIALVQERGDLQLVPPNSLKLDLKGDGQKLSENTRSAVAPPSKRDGGAMAGQLGLRGKTVRKPSWWTARATAGAVKPGFTKAEILKPAPEDPRAPDGVLAKVTGLLEDLGT